MNQDFYKMIENSSAYRKSREENRDFILGNLCFLEDLITIAFTVTNKNHYKACWILELVCEEKITLLVPFINLYCKTISNFTTDQALRSISKIALFLSKNNTILLTSSQEQKIIEACLDWLIQDKKVATKAYSIRTLYNFSKKHPWIKEELQLILTQEYPNHTAAYKAVAREILEKLNKNKL